MQRTPENSCVTGVQAKTNQQSGNHAGHISDSHLAPMSATCALNIQRLHQLNAIQCKKIDPVSSLVLFIFLLVGWGRGQQYDLKVVMAFMVQSELLETGQRHQAESTRKYAMLDRCLTHSFVKLTDTLQECNKFNNKHFLRV